MKVCKICGKIIDADSRAKKYCSPECRARAKYLKDRAWLAEHPEKSAQYGRKDYQTHREDCLKAKHEAYRKACMERFNGESEST